MDLSPITQHIEDPTICGLCGHSKINNQHGLDQNDIVMSEDGKESAHTGSCTYCRECNPKIFAKTQEKS